MPTFRAEIRDAVSGRATLLVVGVLLLQLAFTLSYVGAFHSPKAHHISLGVVAPDQVSGQVVGALNAIPSGPVSARPLPDEAIATSRIRQGKLSAALVVGGSGTDRLLVATAGGASVATAVQQVVEAAEAQQQRTVVVEDLVPVQSGDARGLTGFYLMLGWIVGGYLMAALLGVSKGARPANLRRATIRLLAVVPYAVVSGLGGAVIVDPVLGALTGHFLALSALGALVVFGAAACTMAFQVLFETLGIGLTVLVFVVLGNPSAGGAYQPELLPPFWRHLSDALPNGAATDAIRRIVYFGAHGNAGHLAVLTAYAVAGVAVTAVASFLRGRTRLDDMTTPPRTGLGVTLTHIGGPTVVVEVGDVRFLVDPTFDAPGRYPIGDRALVKTTGPALAPGDLPPIDAVLLSHDQHPDNLDRAGRELLGTAPLTLTTPLAHERLGGSSVGLAPWAEHVVGAVTVTAVPAQHGPDGTEHLTGPVTGFVLSGPDLPTIYVSGDNASLACVDQVVARFPTIDLAVLFAGAAATPLIPDAHLTLTSDDAARAVVALGRLRVLPVHTEGWEHFSEGPDQIDRAFRAAGVADCLIPATPGKPVRV
jgi:L-ascorbate metabolism protein UlaG (beta-lactamase superfamily)